MTVNVLIKKAGAIEWLCPMPLTLILSRGGGREEDEEGGVEYKGVHFNTLAYTNTPVLAFFSRAEPISVYTHTHTHTHSEVQRVMKCWRFETVNYSAGLGRIPAVNYCSDFFI